jgi:hypothetical protein
VWITNQEVVPARPGGTVFARSTTSNQQQCRTTFEDLEPKTATGQTAAQECQGDCGMHTSLLTTSSTKGNNAAAAIDNK